MIEKLWLWFLALVALFIAWLKIRLSRMRKKEMERKIARVHAVARRMKKRQEKSNEAISKAQVEYSQALRDLGLRDFFEEDEL